MPLVSPEQNMLPTRHDLSAKYVDASARHVVTVGYSPDDVESPLAEPHDSFVAY
jgi:hypothetical protein